MEKLGFVSFLSVYISNVSKAEVQRQRGKNILLKWSVWCYSIYLCTSFLSVILGSKSIGSYWRYKSTSQIYSLMFKKKKSFSGGWIHMWRSIVSIWGSRTVYVGLSQCGFDRIKYRISPDFKFTTAYERKWQVITKRACNVKQAKDAEPVHLTLTSLDCMLHSWHHL